MLCKVLLGFFFGGGGAACNRRFESTLGMPRMKMCEKLSKPHPPAPHEHIPIFHMFAAGESLSFGPGPSFGLRKHWLSGYFFTDAIRNILATPGLHMSLLGWLAFVHSRVTLNITCTGLHSTVTS